MITPSKSVTSWILNPSRNERIVWVARKVLGLSRTDPCIGQVIAQGGSGRKFYRFRTTGGISAIVMCYSLDREENPLYADIAGFLQQIQVRVPRILYHDPAQRLIALEDLGDVSLFQVAQKTRDPVRLQTLYRAALDQAGILHRQASCPVKTMPGFCEKLYRWERQYFMENLVARWAKADLSAAELQSLESEGEHVAAELLRAPNCLVHRDFQSQNLLVCQEHVWLIDFQGLRVGHGAYDVASLLYDPYVKLTAPLRTSLMDWYVTHSHPCDPHAKHASPASKSKFVRQLNCAAFQRLMQALGAYAFLGLVKGQPRFLQHIPQGLENLAEVLDHLNEFSHTAALIQKLLARARSEKAPRAESESHRPKNRSSTIQMSANPSA